MRSFFIEIVIFAFAVTTLCLFGLSTLVLLRARHKTLFDGFMIGFATQAFLHNIYLQLGILTAGMLLINWAGSAIIGSAFIFHSRASYTHLWGMFSPANVSSLLKQRLNRRATVLLLLISPQILMLISALHPVQFLYDTQAYHLAQPMLAVLGGGRLPTDHLYAHAGLPIPIQLMSSLFIISGSGLAINLFNFFLFLILIMRIFRIGSRVFGASHLLGELLFISTCIWILLMNPTGNLYNLNSDIPITLFIVYISEKVYSFVFEKPSIPVNTGNFVSIIFVVGFTITAKILAFPFGIVAFSCLFFKYLLLSQFKIRLFKRYFSLVLMFGLFPLIWVVPNYYRFGNPFYPFLTRIFDDPYQDASIPTVVNSVQRSFSQFRSTQSTCRAFTEYFTNQICRDHGNKILFFGVALVASLFLMIVMLKQKDYLAKLYTGLVAVLPLTLFIISGPIIRYHIPFVLLTILTAVRFAKIRPTNLSKSYKGMMSFVFGIFISIILVMSVALTSQHIRNLRLTVSNYTAPQFTPELTFAVGPSDFLELINYVKTSELYFAKICLIGENRLAPFESAAVRAYPGTLRNPFTNHKIKDAGGAYTVFLDDGCSHLAYTSYWGAPPQLNQILVKDFFDGSFCYPLLKNASFILCTLK
jgi:hypothetical protein